MPVAGSSVGSPDGTRVAIRTSWPLDTAADTPPDGHPPRPGAPIASGAPAVVASCAGRPAPTGDAVTVVFVHGWAQSARAVEPLLADPPAGVRLAAVDLRGHGGSDAPDDGYDDPRAWAGDLRAVLDAVGPAVLVGWSYGGLVIADLLATCGPRDVRGVVLTSAITGIGRGVPGGRVGPVMRAALPAALSADRAVAEPALAAFTRDMTARPLDDATRAAWLAAALATPPRVRAALFDRTTDATGAIADAAGAGVPVLVQHGSADRVVDVSCAEHALAVVPGAEADVWDGAGHALFAEDPARFGRALTDFVRRRVAGGERMGT